MRRRRSCTSLWLKRKFEDRESHGWPSISPFDAKRRSTFPLRYAPGKFMCRTVLHPAVDNCINVVSNFFKNMRSLLYIPRVVGHGSDRRKWKRLLIRSPVLRRKMPCEARNGGHGGAGGQRQGHPRRGRENAQRQSGLLSPPVMCCNAGRETLDMRHVGPSARQRIGNDR
jgi:hypothetical protein